MRDRNFHTSINLLMEAGLYQRFKRTARLTDTSMSKIVRDGTKDILDRIEKELDKVMGGKGQ